MASSNRHWPSMFKSKPCNNQQQWSQNHDNQSSIFSNSCSRSSGVVEERSPEPKPRWNPKPEQIRILEAIFNSGMVNPPRDEIMRIRTQLQEYGEVGDANVFYWFQNRKSRSKNKQRALQSKTATLPVSFLDENSPRMILANNGSSSSISTNNSSSYNILGVEQFENSSNSINYFNQIVSQEHIYFALQQNNYGRHGTFFANNNNNNINSNNITTTNNYDPMMNGGDPIQLAQSFDQTGGGFSSLLLGDMFNGYELKNDEVEKFKFQQELSFFVSTQNTTTTSTISSPSYVVSTPISTAISDNIGHISGDQGEVGGAVVKSTVFINGMAIEFANGPVNVKEEFGEDVMLVRASTGEEVMTNEFGATFEALQHGASYYLVYAPHVVTPITS